MELFFLLLLVGLMAFALGAGYPVAFALPGVSIFTIALAGLCGLIFASDSGAFFAQGNPSQWLSAGVTNLRGIYWEAERDTLIAIPLFIFMGIMLQKSRIAEDLLITMAQLFGPVPGGLGISVIFVGALLAATTGIVGATVVAMGLISLPAMLRNNYSQSMATGTIAASGTLGQIIPPSIVLIILADQLASAADQGSSLRKALYKENTGELTMPSQFDVVSTSAGEMFLGAFIPGMVLVGLYMGYVLIAAWLRPALAPPVQYDGRFDRAFLAKVLLTLIPPLVLIFMVLGSIMSGVATVNQAGAIGAAGALLMAGYRLCETKRLVYTPAILCVTGLVGVVIITQMFNTNIKNIHTTHDMAGVILAIIACVFIVTGLVWSGWRVFKISNTLESVMIETAKTTSLVFIILLGAAILTAAFRAFGGEHLIREFLEGLPGGFWFKFFVVMAVMFILGFFLDFIEIAVVVVPIVAPILLSDPSANVTAVWLGVMIGLNIQTSFLTPPFGFALFYLRGVAPKIVKTLNMYKGVIPFILLQLGALGIVAYVPSLVNYLPNRVSLLSDNSPPPRNPRLNYCVNNYIADNIGLAESGIMTAVEGLADVRADLPDKWAGDIADALDSAPRAIALYRAAQAQDDLVAEAARVYAPLHRFVRRLERDIRRLEAEAERLQSNSVDQTSLIEHEVVAIRAEQARILAEVPVGWAEADAVYKAVLKDRTNAYRLYERTAMDAYEPIAGLLAILRANEDLAVARDGLMALQVSLARAVPKDIVERLGEFKSWVRGSAGLSAVADLVSKAERAMKARSPDAGKAGEQLVLAADMLEAESWRISAAADMTVVLEAYEGALRGTLGMKAQSRLSREQALYVSSCQAAHRDISLNF